MSRNVVVLILAMLIASSAPYVAIGAAQEATPEANVSTLPDAEIRRNAGAAMADWFVGQQPAGGAPSPEPSADPGTGWILDRHFAFADRVDIAVGGTGTLWAVAGFPALFGPPGLTLFASVDGGYGWSVQGGLGGGPLDDSYGNPSIAVDVFNERIYIVFENQTTGTVGVMFGDPVGGWGFFQVPFGGFGEYTPDVVVENDNGANNRVYVAYMTIPGNPASANIDLQYSDDDGATWTLSNVDGWTDFGTPRFQPAIAYANGYVWIVDQNNSAIDVLLTIAVQAVPPTGAWTYSNIVPPVGASFSNPDIAVTRDGTFGAVVVEDNLGNVQSYFSIDSGVTWPYYAPLGASVDAEHSPSLTADFMSSSSNAVAGRFHANWDRDAAILGSALWYGVIDTANLLSGWSSQMISDTANAVGGTGQFVTGITTQPRGLALTEYPVAVGISSGATAFATTPGWTTTLDTIPSGLGFAITVDSVDCIVITPCTYSWPADTDHTVFAASPQLTNLGVDQWIFWYWETLGAPSPQGYTLTAPAAGDYSDYAWLVHQFWVTVDTVPVPLDVIVDGTAYPPFYADWWNETEVHTINVTSPQPGGGPGERWVWDSWSIGGPQEQGLFALGPFGVTARFLREFQVTVDTGPTGAPITVNAVMYPTTPQVFWWPEGSVQSLDAPQYLYISGSDRLNFGGWSDFDLNLVRPYDVLFANDMIVANYGPPEEWLQTVDTSPAGLDYWVDDVLYTAPTSWWYVDGSQHWLNTTAIQPGPLDTRYVFQNWTDGSPASNNAIIVVAPFDYVADFNTQFNITIDTQPAGLWFQVDGTTWHQAAQSFWWDALSVHSVSMNLTSPTGLNFAGWTDGDTSNPRSVLALGPGTFTANYTSAPVGLNSTASANVTSGQAPLSVQFSSSAIGGSGSYIYTWDFDDGSTSFAQNPLHVFSSPGTYIVNVWVNDTGGNWTSHPLSITALVSPPVLDSCSITPSAATILVSTTLTFIAQGWNGTTELSPITVVWSVTGGIGTITSGGLFTAGTAGSGTVVADVTFSTMTVQCSVLVTVTTTPPPTVDIVTPLTGAIAEALQTVTGTSTNATFVQVRIGTGGPWLNVTGVSSWSIVLDLRTLPNANYFIEAIARNGSVDSTPDSISVLRNNSPPGADAGSDQLGRFRNAAVALDGSGSSDPNAGDVLSFSWTQISGPTVTVTGGSTETPSVVPTQAGIYVFELTVSDGTLSDTDSVSIEVINRAPTIDVMNPTAPTQNGPRGTPMTLMVTASDLDSDPLTYTWTVNGLVQSSITDTFAFPATDDGVYYINVTVTDGTATDTAGWVVTIAFTPPQQPAEIPWLAIGLLLAIIVAAILFMLFLMKRRKKPAEDLPLAAAPGQWAAAPEEPTTMPVESTETPQEWGSPAAAPAAPVVAPAATPATAVSPQDPMVQLTRLRELKDQGLISDQEYEAKRKQLLEKL